jgi:hypothetical protein
MRGIHTRIGVSMVVVKLYKDYKVVLWPQYYWALSVSIIITSIFRLIG